MIAAARLIIAVKLGSVLSLRIAIRLKSLSLPEKVLIRCRHLWTSRSMASGATRLGRARQKDEPHEIAQRVGERQDFGRWAAAKGCIFAH